MNYETLKLSPQPTIQSNFWELNVVFIISCVWAAVYRNAGEVFGKNRLHPCIQSAVDGKRQRLETFRNKLVDARRRGLHFEQVRSRYVARRQSFQPKILYTPSFKAPWTANGSS